jgi:hypothetical protein|nr:MAG TPA: Ribbon-helix-helix domain [Caudoviricetes sp.]
MAQESRAEYMKDRRANFKAFHVEVEKERMKRLEDRLDRQGKTKKQWLDEKIDEELGK